MTGVWARAWGWLGRAVLGRARPAERDVDWAGLRRRLQYDIHDRALFRTALRHSSHPSCAGGADQRSNERLEFLGDAVVHLVIGKLLYLRHPHQPEGDLTKMRSMLVSRHVMAQAARDLHLGSFLLMGAGEEKTGGRRKESVLGNAYEAVVAAVYLDGGEPAAEVFVRRTLFARAGQVLTDGARRNYKGALLELCQGQRGSAPRYVVRQADGADHLKRYTIDVVIGGVVCGTGSGSNKKRAEQRAAEQALRRLGKEPGAPQGSSAGMGPTA